MALTGIIALIDSALHYVELLVKDSSRYYGKDLKVLRHDLRNLKTFVLMKFGSNDDGSLRSLLGRIEDALHTNVERINSHGHQLSNEHVYFHSCLISEFNADITSLMHDVDHMTLIYILTLELVAVFDSSSLQSPCCCTTNEVLEVIDSIFENLVDLECLPEMNGVHEVIEAGAKMTFIKILLRFVAAGSVGEDLLAHVQTLTLHASFLVRSRVGKFGFRSDVRSNIQILLQKLQPTESGEIYARALSRSKLQRRLLDDDVVRDFVESIIFELWELLRSNTCGVSKKDLQRVYEGLRSLRTVLKNKKQQPDKFSMKVKDAIGDALCDAGVFVCSVHQTKGEAGLFGLIEDLLDTINTVLVDVGAKERQLPMLHSLPSQEDRFSTSIEADVLNDSPPKTNKQEIDVPSLGAGSSLITNGIVVGFQEEQTLFVDQLTRGSKQRRIVAIVGMPGLGKTTLATKVYSNPYVARYFLVRAWCPVSQAVDKKKVLMHLLNQIDPSKCSETLTENDLAEKLWKSLRGRRYLIFLDDIWETEAWDVLKASFPDDDCGSRILLTSRVHHVAPLHLLVDEKPHSLRQLNQEESMELFWIKLSSGNAIPALPLDIGMKVTEKCGGLPLIIVIVAGVLKNLQREDWDEILDGMSNISSTEQCRNTLELSYKHLPACLRPCLLYFGGFPEDQEVSVRRLLRLWIAEGFVQKDDDMKSAEVAAEQHLNDLIGRSLLMVGKQRFLGGVKTCRIHDLVHDFCLQKAKDENFFHFINGYDELRAFNEPHNLQRLCIYSEAEHFVQSRLCCPRARSLILNRTPRVQNIADRIHWYRSDLSSAIHMFKHLKVLDLEQVYLGDGFPSEIKLLFHLAFLAIGSIVSEIPSWIGNLLNLETFIVQGLFSQISLPESFWNLQKLQYLYLGIDCRASLPTGDLDSSANLYEMDRLTGATITPSKMESLLRKFPNIRKLKCQLQNLRGNCRVIVIPDCLSRLESLHLIYDRWYSPSVVFDEFSLPANLKSLTLEQFNLSCRNISVIEVLPNLEVLKLVGSTFEERTWAMKGGAFPKLKLLKLSNLRLLGWCTDCDCEDEQLKCLEKLVLESQFLVEMPCCLENLSTLEVIEVSYCLPKVVDLVKQIEAQREELMGDSNLTIILRQ